MIDHISLRVSDLPRAVEFYKAALAPLGYVVLMEFPETVGMGAGGKPDLWITGTDEPVNPTHIALSGDRDRVHAFHEAALYAGGTDNGEPGPRPDYHPHYYAAFVTDPEGNNLEVVCHSPPGAPAGDGATPTPARPAKKKAAPKAAAKAAKKKPAKAAKKKPAAKSAKKPAAKKKPAGKKRR